MPINPVNKTNPYKIQDFSQSLFGPEKNEKFESLVEKLPFEENSTVDSVPVDSGCDRYTSTYRNNRHPEKLVSNIHPQLSTYNELFVNAVKLYGERPCLGSRPYDYKKGQSEQRYESFSYEEVNQRRLNLGSGIIKAMMNNPFKKTSSTSHAKIDNHLKDWAKYGNKSGDREENCSFIVSIFSANRLEWVLADLACSAYSLTNTALYDTLGTDATRYILDLTRSPIVLASRDKIKVLLDLKKQFPEMLSDLISIVSMDPLVPDDASLILEAKNTDITLHDIHQIEELGMSSSLEELPPTPETLYTISFTSGTTGSKPKGVMLTHKNAATAVTFLTSTMPHVDLGKAFIFLPLTHIYERKTTGFALSTGYYLGFPQLTVSTPTPKNTFDSLMEDLSIFKPNYLSLVPRILTKIESVIKSTIENSDTATSNRLKSIIDYKLKKQREFDGSVGINEEDDAFPPYKNLRSLFGFENLLWTQTASAPISPTTIVYLKASLNIGLRQLYGLTESFGAVTLSGSHESNPGSCGSIGVGCEMKLEALPGMDYHAKDNKGELLLRGPQIFDGYYRDREETDKALDSEGWFHTGDVAKIHKENGRLYIIDRVKNFFKLSQGEYVSPEKVENIYLSSNPNLAQLYVHGDSLKSFLVAIVGIDYGPGIKFLREKCACTSELSPEQMLSEINKIDNKRKFLASINSPIAKRLQGFERLNNVYIDINPLTVDRDVVTPTLKIKRGIAAKYFNDVFTKLYEEQSLTKPKL